MTSESCSNPTFLRCILRQIEYGVFSRPDTHACDAVLGQHALELVDDARDDVAAALAQEFEPRDDRIARIRVDLREGEVLELVLHRAHADALGERRVDVHRLARDAQALVGAGDVMERAHVVQAVGELDQQHADVLRHRDDELAEILRLAALVATAVRAATAW